MICSVMWMCRDSHTNDIGRLIAKTLGKLTLKDVKQCLERPMAEYRMSELSFTQQFKHATQADADHLQQPHRDIHATRDNATRDSTFCQHMYCDLSARSKSTSSKSSDTDNQWLASC